MIKRLADLGSLSWPERLNQSRALPDSISRSLKLIETVGTEITVEGDAIDYEQLVREIESSGAVVHGIDEIAVGSRLVENVKRQR